MEAVMQKGKEVLSWFWEQLKQTWNSQDRCRIFVVIGLIGMGLILLTTSSGSKEKQRENKSQISCDLQQSAELSNEAYILQTENRLEEIISQISGAGDCTVMLTLKEGSRKIYANESKTNYDNSSDADSEQLLRSRKTDSREEKLVLLESGNGVTAPIVEKIIEPQINGVIVVCQGGKSAKVCQEITQAVTTVLGIRSTQVCVSAKDRLK